MSQKRQLLIDIALKLFYQNGINSIGINEILKSSGVAKRTLYNHFESKDALVLAALEQRHQNFIGWLKQKLEGSQSNIEVVEAIFGALNSWFKGKEAILGDFRGCFFINTSAEFSDSECDISKYCGFHKQQVRSLIQQYLGSESSDLLDAICIMQEGAIVMAYMTGNSDEVTTKSIDILKKL